MPLVFLEAHSVILGLIIPPASLTLPASASSLPATVTPIASILPASVTIIVIILKTSVITLPALTELMSYAFLRQHPL